MGTVCISCGEGEGDEVIFRGEMSEIDGVLLFVSSSRSFDVVLGYRRRAAFCLFV
jgi:hypothetical protein